MHVCIIIALLLHQTHTHTLLSGFQYSTVFFWCFIWFCDHWRYIQLRDRKQILIRVITELTCVFSEALHTLCVYNTHTHTHTHIHTHTCTHTHTRTHTHTHVHTHTHAHTTHTRLYKHTYIHVLQEVNVHVIARKYM